MSNKNEIKNLKAKYTVNADSATLHISNGNSKLGKGIYNFSTLPGNENHMLYIKEGSELLIDIPGTCSKFCDGCFGGGCYAVRDAKLHHNATVKAWAENTLLLRDKTVFALIDNYITKKNAKYVKTKDPKYQYVKMFRINVSGEIEDVSQLRAWNKICLNHPEVAFGLYTKNFDAVSELVESGDSVAENFCINISQWNHVADDFLAKYPDRFNVFEYDETNRRGCAWSDEDKKRLAGMTHCPAVNKSGHHAKGADGKDITCIQCGRCYGKRGKCLKTAVYSH